MPNEQKKTNAGKEERKAREEEKLDRFLVDASGPFQRGGLTRTPPPSQDNKRARLIESPTEGNNNDILKKIWEGIKNLGAEQSRANERLSSIEANMEEERRERREEIKELKKEVSELREQLGEYKKNEEWETKYGEVSRRLESEIGEIREKSLLREELETKNNIIVRGLKENKQERPTESIAKVEELLKRELKIEENIIMEATRIGRQKEEKDRPIKVRLDCIESKWKVLKEKKKLPQNIFIDEDYTEVRRKRAELMPWMKKARGEGDRAYLKKDKLEINRELYVLEEDKGGRGKVLVKINPKKNERREETKNGARKV